VAARVAEVNAHLPSYETLKAFHIFDEPLTVERELLTASLKVRRKKVVEAFRAEREALYDRPAPERR
jgi:long-chain acyl-CoA synthetase